MPTKSKVLQLFFLLALLQVAILFFVIPWFHQLFPSDYAIDGFQDKYDFIAMNLVQGHGFRVYAETSETLLRMPGFVYFLAGLFYIFGKSLVAVKVANMVLAFSVAYLMFLLQRRVVKNDGWRMVAPAIYLMHPATLAAESRGGVEMFFSFLIVLSTFTLYRALEHDRLRDYVLLGIVLGVTVLTRSTPIVFPAVLFVYLLVRRRSVDLRPVVSRIAVLTLAMFVVISPWLVRNYQVAGIFSPKETVAGLTAYNGYYINDRWRSDVDLMELYEESAEEQRQLAKELGLPHMPGFYQYFYNTKDEVRFNDYLLRLVFREYLASPLKLPRTLTLNFIRFWFSAGTWRAIVLNAILVLPLLVLVGFGLRSAIRSQTDIWPMLLLPGTILLMHLPILGAARYHVPIIPLLLIVAVIPFVRHNLTAERPA